MRIIAGTLGGRTLTAPAGHVTRPTTDRTRSAIFSLIESRLDLDDIHVLDVFAGTGALGLEALSRGAAHATFVENHADAFAALRTNVERLGVSAQVTMLRTDVLRTLPSLKGAYRLVLADPPYNLPSLPKLPNSLLVVVAPGGLVVLEHDIHTSFEGHPALVTTRRYGETQVSLFSKTEAAVQVPDEPAPAPEEQPPPPPAPRPKSPRSKRKLDLFWVADY
ncbi:MAG TPA: 16S rRNA (guanine(966)-N(2))-methyltransferase RsmD [Rhodothermales bacterium]|nr:16S rRNA (guanine(966)-N(2))-methyltransferase RsmD [Rhodothermales bacterium]